MEKNNFCDFSPSVRSLHKFGNNWILTLCHPYYRISNPPPIEEAYSSNVMDFGLYQAKQMIFSLDNLRLIRLRSINVDSLIFIDNMRCGKSVYKTFYDDSFWTVVEVLVDIEMNSWKPQKVHLVPLRNLHDYIPNFNPVAQFRGELCLAQTLKNKKTWPKNYIFRDCVGTQ